MRAFCAATLVLLSSVVLAAPHDLDQTFLTNVGLGLTGLNYGTPEQTTGAVNAVALQADGKIFAGGNLSKFNNTGTEFPLRRLNVDGTLDPSFNTGGAGPTHIEGHPEIDAIFVQGDGKIYIGGTFNYYNGTPIDSLARLNADGTLDTDFVFGGITNGLNQYVQDIKPQADGKLIIGGSFTGIAGSPRYNLARINTDGSLDTDFAPSDLVGTSVINDVAVDSSGRIYVSGAALNNARQRYEPVLRRYFANGSRDVSFNPQFGDNYGSLGAIAVLSDGRIVIGGTFALAGATTLRSFAILNPDGSLDAAAMGMNAGSFDGDVFDIIQSLDGRILVSGIFTDFSGQPRASIARFNLDGSLDATFAPVPYDVRNGGYTAHLYSIAQQPDGRIVAGGWFNHISNPGLEINNLVRFEGDFTGGAGSLGFTGATFSVDENAGTATISVARYAGVSGAASVNYAATTGTAGSGDFIATSGSLSWGAGEGGVKTFTVGITNDSSAESTESITLGLSSASGASLVRASATLNLRDDDSAPTITASPVSQSVDQAMSFTLFVNYDSVLAATVQWYLNGDPIPAATSPAYSVAAAYPGLHAGNYTAIVTNLHGSTPSAVATVTVAVPSGSLTMFAPPVSNTIPPIKAAAFDSSGRIVAAATSASGGFFRLNTNGTRDNGFASHTFNNLPTSLLIQPDGKILAAGTYTLIDGGSPHYLARLNTDGSLDATQPAVIGGVGIQCLAPGTGGKFYVGKISNYGLQRCLADGINDSSFVPAAALVGVTEQPNGYIWSVKELSANGPILVAYQTYTGGFQAPVIYKINRLLNGGSLDNTFTSPALNQQVYGFDVLPDGRVAIAGRFTTVAGVTRNRLAILKTDGSLDPSFDAGPGLNNDAYGVRFIDGRLYVWGGFTQAGGQAIQGIARFNLDGTLDSTFAIGAGTDSTVNDLQIAPDGNILIGGNFTSVKGVSRYHAAILERGPDAITFFPPNYNVIEGAANATLTVQRFGKATGAVSVHYTTVAGTASVGDDFTATSGTLTWNASDLTPRTISVPIVSDSTAEPLEKFTVTLEPATVTGNAVLVVPTAEVTVIDNDNPPTILTPPLSQTVAQAATATFTVVVDAVPAATYQWTFNNSDLSNGTVAGVTIAGATTATLTLTNVGPAQIGLYRVRVTNLNGPVTSDPASLAVTANPAFLDATFPGAPGGPTALTINNRVNVVLPLPDGGAYIGGRFTNFNNVSGRSYLVKISADGTLDTTFAPAPNSAVLDLRLVGGVLYVISDPGFGNITTIGGGSAVSGFAAIDGATGARMTSFMTNLGATGANNTVRALAVFPDGDVLLGGDFTSFGNVANTRFKYFARINSDGTLESNFDSSNATGYNGATTTVVTAVDVGPDGKFVAGGAITYGIINRLVRITGAGALDATFAPATTSLTALNRIHVLADGKVLATGSSLPGSRTYMRMNVDGSFDTNAFFGTTSSNAYDCALQFNGRSILVGAFSFVRANGAGNTTGLARFDTVGAYENAWPTGVGFDNTASTVALAEDGRIWVGGEFTSYNGAAIQRLIRLNGDPIPLAITLQPKATDVNPSATAVFTARATGTSTLSYQWFKGTSPLSDGGRISGATTAQLTVTGAIEADEGAYSLRVTNASGQVTSNAAALVVLGAPEILSQPAPAVTGLNNRAFSFEVTARGIAPLDYQWRKHGTPITNDARITGATTSKLSFSTLALADADDYDVIVTNSVNSVTMTPATILTVNLAPTDRAPTFASVSATSTSIIRAILPLSDGGALVGGSFNALNGASGTVSGGRLARVLANGQVVPTGILPVFNGDVYTIARQPDGKIVVGGGFTSLTPPGGSPVTRNGLARLNADLSLDTSFVSGTPQGSVTLSAIAVDALGRIYVGGTFTSWANVPKTANLVRLRDDGSVDPSFGLGLSNSVNVLMLDPDGGLFVGGAFFGYKNQDSDVTFGNYLMRLVNGQRDLAFNYTLGFPVQDIALQPDGKVLAALSSSNSLHRFLTTGIEDTAFTVSPATSVSSVALQPNGSIVAAGAFTSYGGIIRSGLVRTSVSGSVDSTFDIAGSNTVSLVRVDAYGRVWVGGNFTVFNNDFSTRSIAVLNGDPVALGFAAQPAPQAVAPGQTATFNVIATGTTALSYVWKKDDVPLANDVRISGATTASLTIANVQAGDAGIYTVAVNNASGGIISAGAPLVVLGSPEILIAPLAATVEAGTAANLYVKARGAGTLTYQWLKDGNPIANSAAVTGATTPSLTLSPTVLADGGSYKVRITGSAGVTTTVPVILTITKSPAAVARSVVLPTFNNTVSALLPLDDGTFFAGGSFTTVTWTGGSATRNRFAKIKADGSADLTFPTVNSNVTAIARDSTGKIYVGGDFTTMTLPNSTVVTRNRILRLNADGSLDTAFDPLVGPNSTVRGIKFDSTGRIYIYGAFSSYRAEASSGYVARLNADGSRDSTFASKGTNTILDLEFTSGGNLWLAHANSWDSQLRIILVDTAGTKVPTFAYSGTMSSTGLGLLSGDSVLSFASSFPFIQKIDLNGAITAGFPIGGGPGASITQHAAAGTQFYLNGSFTTYGGSASPNIVRINADGTRDPSFAPGVGFNGTVDTMIADSSGRLWVGGSFVSYNNDTTLTKLVVLNGGVAESNSGTPVDPLANFLENAGVPQGQRGPNDDPDRDGISNLLEYALELQPMTADPDGLPVVTRADGRLHFTYIRARAELTYEVETTTALGSIWSTTGVDQGTPAGDGLTTASIAIDVQHRFIHLKVTQP